MNQKKKQKDQKKAKLVIEPQDILNPYDDTTIDYLKKEGVDDIDKFEIVPGHIKREETK